MDSAHHQLTVHTNIGHLRSPVELRQHHQLSASTTSTAQSSLHSASMVPEALRTITIRTHNTNSLLSEHARIALFLFATFYAFDAFDAIKPPRFRVVLSPPRFINCSFMPPAEHNENQFSHSHQKPLSASALRIQNALFLTLLQRHIKSHFLQVPSASRMHCSLRIRSVTPKATLQECTPHSACIVLPRPGSVNESHFP